MTHAFAATALALVMLGMSGPSRAADTAPPNAAPDAEASDPRALGWMQGFPPPPDKRLSAADGSFFRFPALRWSVVHMREFLPTVEVSRGLGAPVPLPVALDGSIDAIRFTPTGARAPMTWKASLAANYTDGLVVLHRGRLVYEFYAGELREDRSHAAMSVTKSLTGTLAAMLAAEGVIDPAAPVTRYVPELAGSAFADVRVRDVMDMTTCLRYSEDYADPEAEIWEYAKASNPLPQPGAEVVGTTAYLRTLQPEPGCRVGEAFAYKTPNADVLGWIVARASGKSVATLLSERIWRRMGMEQAGYFQVDATGMPVAGGGFSAGLRDMARFGQLLLDGGSWQGEQLIPRAVVEDIRKGGSRAAFARSGHPGLVGWSYRYMWWVTHNAHGAFAARGVHGQTVYIDPKAEMVIVRFASHPQAANAANDATSLPAYQALADHLLSRDGK